MCWVGGWRGAGAAGAPEGRGVGAGGEGAQRDGAAGRQARPREGGAKADSPHWPLARGPAAAPRLCPVCRHEYELWPVTWGAFPVSCTPPSSHLSLPRTPRRPPPCPLSPASWAFPAHCPPFTPLLRGQCPGSQVISLSHAAAKWLPRDQSGQSTFLSGAVWRLLGQQVLSAATAPQPPRTCLVFVPRPLRAARTLPSLTEAPARRASGLRRPTAGSCLDCLPGKPSGLAGPQLGDTALTVIFLCPSWDPVHCRRGLFPSDPPRPWGALPPVLPAPRSVVLPRPNPQAPPVPPAPCWGRCPSALGGGQPADLPVEQGVGLAAAATAPQVGAHGALTTVLGAGRGHRCDPGVGWDFRDRWVQREGAGRARQP